MTSTYILYQFPGDDELPSISPPCLKVAMALKLLDLPHRLQNLQTPPEVARVSPTGRLPVLETPQGKIADSVCILDTLAELRGAAPLAPADPGARARDRVWEAYATQDLYWMGIYGRFCIPAHYERFLDAALGAGFSFTKLGARFLLRNKYRKRCIAQGLGTRSVPEVLRAFSTALETVEAGLEGGPFLGGREQPGRGDLGLAAVLAQAGWQGTQPEYFDRLRTRPQLVAYLKRVFEACHLNAPAWTRS